MEDSNKENSKGKIHVPDMIDNIDNTNPNPDPNPNPTPDPILPITPIPPTPPTVNDPFSIKVTITDTSTPIIILFGAGASGKTMTLVRLTRWLTANGYQVDPDRNFRSSGSAQYEQMCNLFMDMVNSDYAADRTHLCNFMLIKVRNHYGEPICQILEAPGEHYFDYKNPRKQFPPYITTIRNSSNPKTWMFIVEKDWAPTPNPGDSNATLDFPEIRRKYAEKVQEMENSIRPTDKVIFTCHKADLHPGLFVAGRPNAPQFFREVDEQYPGIFSRYKNRNLITRLWRKYNFDFVIFSAGSFNNTYEGGQFYSQSEDQYPASLWKAIMKTVRGGW